MSYIWKDEKNAIDLEYLYCVEGYITYMVSVKSGEFTGKYSFTNSLQYFSEIIDIIDRQSLNVNEIIIRDYDTDSLIKIYTSHQNKTTIATGLIGGSHNSNVLKFEFESDLSIYSELNKVLISFLNIQT